MIYRTLWMKFCIIGEVCWNYKGVFFLVMWRLIIFSLNCFMTHAHIAQIGRSVVWSVVYRSVVWSVSRSGWYELATCLFENKLQIDTLPRCSASVLRIVLTSLLSVVRLLRTSKSNSAISFHRALNFTFKLFNLYEFLFLFFNINFDFHLEFVFQW